MDNSDNSAFQRELDDPACTKRTPHYKVERCYPHDPKAYTEGLQFYNGLLYESTGVKGLSSLRRIDLTTGKVEKFLVNKDYFAEGLTVFEEKVFQLIERPPMCLIYDVRKLSDPPREVHLTAWDKVWGLTNDGKNLILTDGSENLFFLNPGTFEVVGKPLKVHYSNGAELSGLNELEYANGYIYANIHPEEFAVRIDSRDGLVLKEIDFRPIRPEKVESCIICNANGIAYEAKSGHLFITGKLWPLLFEVSLTG